VQSNDTLGSKEEVSCGISNALDGSQNSLIYCNKALLDMSIAYGVTVDVDGASESNDPFKSGDSSDKESDTCSDDPFNYSEPE